VPLFFLQREGEHPSLASQPQGPVPEIASSSTSLMPGLNGNSSSCIVKVRFSLVRFYEFFILFYWHGISLFLISWNYIKSIFSFPLDHARYMMRQSLNWSWMTFLSLWVSLHLIQSFRRTMQIVIYQMDLVKTPCIISHLTRYVSSLER
jgi:hypothetical protein